MDGMLGGLARWLRMLGQDVVYSTQLSDNELLELAKKEQRALLTRDLELYKRANSRGLDTFYVDDQTESGRLTVVAKRYGVPLNVNMNQANCPLCNTPLESAPKEQLADRLQKGTYNNYNQFWQCPHCKQVYWQGSHWKQIQRILKQTQQKL
ncbi:MAG: Mut7-C RNAse domain-containing protein [Candidatus Bathyarchaeota archaeon]|nr:Mut7-C RNAse domain-containing protein [Candidatus Bathyarchaeota archaeon]